MPSKAAPRTPKQERAEKAATAKKLLAGVRGRRDESEEDEDDWEWIWGEEGRGKAGKEEEESADEGDDTETPRKRKRRRVERVKEEKIIGARKGRLEVRVGDPVILDSKTGSEWVGIIMSFLDEGEKCADILWFTSPEEIHETDQKRSDFLPNERYIMPGTDVNPLDSINGKAIVMSENVFEAKYPNGKPPRKSKEYDETFVCRRAYDDRSQTYSDIIVWEKISRRNETEVLELLHLIKKITKPMKGKRKYNKHKEGDDDFKGGNPDEDEIMETPRKKQKHSVVTTPKKPKTPSKLLTPSHKKIIIKKPLEFTPLGTRILDLDSVASSPFQTARSRLHVSSVPTSLPCREEEFSSVYSHLSAAITEGTGACIYISGTPGTGKTATVREVVAQLSASVQAEELDDFIFVEINGMKVTDPHQSYSLLWEALKGDRVSPSHALDLLEREFNHPSPRRVPCVVLMDELDQLVTKNQSVMYNFFNWPSLRHSRLIVLAVANTMDLPERTLSNKISSRLGLTRITFPGYTHDQLMKIIQSRLEGVEGDFVSADAIQFASRKVAAVSGDARRALDICRRAVELAESDSLNPSAPNTPSKSKSKLESRNGKEDKEMEIVRKNAGKVTIATIKRAINEATTSPLQQYLRGLPLASKVLLASLLAKTRRTGLSESILGEVLDEAKRLMKLDTGNLNMIEYLLKDHSSSSSRSGGNGGGEMVKWNGKGNGKTPRVLGMGTAAVDLMEAGIIGLEARRVDRMGKVRLCVGEEDVKQALKDDFEVKGLGF